MPAPAVAGPGSLEGAVVDDAGKPVAAATIRLSNGATATSDARGRFVIAGLPDGTYAETVGAARFEPFRTIARVPSPPQRIVLRPSLASLRVIGSVISHARTPFNDTPAAAKVFPREAYRDQGQADLASVLMQTAGGTPASSRAEDLAAPGAPAFASVRYSAPFETAASIDGVPLTLASSGAFDTSLVPSFVLGDVEIGKGPGDVAAIGPNAVAGTLNLRTADPTATRRALAELSADSRGGSFADLAYGGSMPGGKISFAAMLAADGSPGPLDGAAFPVAVDRPGMRVNGHPLLAPSDPYATTALVACCAAVPSDALRRAQFLKVRYAPNDAFTLTATALTTQRSRALAGALGMDLPLAFGGAPLATFASGASSFDEREEARLGFFDLDARVDRGRDGFDARIYAVDVARDRTLGAAGGRVYALRGTAIYADGTPPESFAGSPATVTFATPWTPRSQRDRVRGARLAWQHESAAGLFVFSAERRDAAASGDVAGSASDTLFNASLERRPNARTEIDLGAGVDRHDAAGRSWTMAAWRAGWSFRPFDRLALRAAFGTSFAPPPLAALQAPSLRDDARIGLPPGVTISGGSALGAERAFGYDLGAEWRLPGNATTLSADVYHTHLAGTFARRIDAASPGFLALSWYAAAPRDDSGVEASLVQFKRVGLGFIAQAAFARAGRDLRTGAYLSAPEDTAPLCDAPFAQGYGEISYHWPRGSRLSLGALYLGARNPYADAAFAAFNTNLELSLGPKAKLQISVENLFDAMDARLPFAGRNAFAPRTIRIMFRQSAGAGAVYER